MAAIASLVEDLVVKTGIPEASLRILIGLVLGTPLSIVYRFSFYRQNVILQHLYFIISGLAVLYFVFGATLIHQVLSIFIAYLLVQISGPCMRTVVSMFIFAMGYLLVGYYVNSTTDYDVNWTTPQCIVTLRLIAYAWDCYDGQQKKEDLSKDLQTTCLETSPSLLELYGACLFPGGLLVGPQFSIRKYLDLVHGKLVDEKISVASSLLGGLQCLFVAVFFIVIHLFLSPHYQNDFLLTDEFKIWPLYRQLWHLIWWGKVSFFRYILVWKLAECSCIITGLGFNGLSKDGTPQWDGLTNIRPLDYELTWTFGGLIPSFNVNTNIWVGRYVFKRLRFLGNKSISHLCALMFLALWHGLYIGYFLNFLLEFIVIHIERPLMDMMYKLTKTSLDDLPPVVSALIKLLAFINRSSGFAFCIISFHFLTWGRIMKVYSAMNYFYIYVFISGFILVNVITKLVKIAESRKPKAE